MVKKKSSKRKQRKIYGLYRCEFRPPVDEPLYILAENKDEAWGIGSKILAEQHEITARPHISLVRRITEGEYDRLFDKGTYRGRVIIDESGW